MSNLKLKMTKILKSGSFFFNDAHLQVVFEKEKPVLVSWAVAMDDEENIQWP